MNTKKNQFQNCCLLFVYQTKNGKINQKHNVQKNMNETRDQTVEKKLSSSIRRM